jgi:hypothetical protein
MFRRRITGPDGRKWTLGRRWLPRRKRFKKADLGDVGPDGGFLDIGGDDLGIFAVIIAVIVGLFVAVFVVLLLFNVFALALELLILIVVALAGVISRVVFRRPWIVFARHGDTRLEWPVVGYFNSRRKLAEIGGQLALGAQLEPAPLDRR